MDDLSQITPAEYKEIDRLIGILSECAGHPLSLKALIDLWKTFVARVSEGYNDSIYEYTNDLSVRDVLEDLMVQLREPTRQKIITIIEPFDRQFFDATYEVSRPIVSGVDNTSSIWWKRVPKKLGKELEEDLNVD